MAKGTRYTPEFKAKAVRLLTESRGSYPSEAKTVEQVARDPGGRAGDAAPLARQGGRHGRVRVPQDARPVVGAGLGSGRDRSRPGDERHAGIGNPRRAPPVPVAARPARARAAGLTSWNAGSRRRRRCGRWNRRYHGPPRMAARTVSCTVPAMARRCIGLVYATGVGKIRHASPDRHGRRLVWQRHDRGRRRRVQDRARLATQALPGFEGPGIGDVPMGLEAEASNRLHRSLGCRTLEAVETEYYANQEAQAASL